MGHVLLHGRGSRHRDDDQHFDAWSRTYDRSPSQVLFFGPVQRSVVAAVTPRVRPGPVLDIGSGTGRLLDRLGQALRQPALFGLDRSAGMVAAAHRARPHLRLTRGTAEALPFPDASFALVTTTLSFHHWSDQAAALADVHRVLRPGGLFALVDASADDFPRWPGFGRAAARRVAGHMLPLGERRSLLEAAHLRIVGEKRAWMGRWIPITLAERAAA